MNMFRFEHPELLNGLWLLLPFLLLFIFWLRWQRRVLGNFGDRGLVRQMLPRRSPLKQISRFILWSLAWVFLVLGLANPQIGSKLVEAERKGIDLMICLDVSNSMLAEDIQPNRLERAKQALSKLIDKLGNDRIGIVVFAGNAYFQLPITTDHAAAKMYLNTISTRLVPTQGTAIGEALEKAAESFDDDSHTRAIVVITDGENHEDDPVKAAKELAEKGIFIYTLGMGLPEGAPIPVYNQAGRQTGYKKDRSGQTVITRLDENTLQKVAEAGNGIYVRANNTTAGLSKIFDEINSLEKTTYESQMFSEYESRFQYFIALALLMLLIEMLIFERKNIWLNRYTLFGE